MNGHHICMSGNGQCSGIDPCDPCASAIATYVLMPAMKAIGLDRRNDPRLMAFLQAYSMNRRGLVQLLLSRAPQAPQAPPPPPPPPPPPQAPPIADLPLTEGELEGMSHPVAPGTVPAPSAELVGPAMAGGPEEPEPPPVPPAGLMSDEEFKAKFPKAQPEDLFVGYEPPPPPPPPAPPPAPEPEALTREPSRVRTTDDGTYPDVEEAKAKNEERAKVVAVDLPGSSTSSLLKLAQDATTHTPKLPAEQPSDEREKVGSAPTEPAPPSASQPKAPEAAPAGSERAGNAG